MKKILIVDDDRLNLLAAKDTLNELYEVETVESGEQALKYLTSNPCDLIILDINMPDMDGFEVLHKIREYKYLQDTPVIFLTADSDSQTETRCLEEGAMDFIAKPYAPAVMVSRIGRVLEFEDMRKKLSDKLEKKIQEVRDIKMKSNQDTLTGLWNRTYTEKNVNRRIREGSKGFLFMIDMDNFKAINDHYGHIEGDNTLKMFADTMRKYSKEKDVLCRIGGDEFVMYIEGNKSKKEIGRLAANIIGDLCSKIEKKKYETNSSVSIGIAQIPEDGTEFNTVYNAADKALYYVKQNGKNAYHFFSEQKEEENARGSTLVDIKYLSEIMSREDTGKGAYQLELDSFHHVYNFIRRFVERSGQNVQTVLFTAYSDVDVEQGEIDVALEILEKAIYTSLRRVDVSTRYSSRQIIVILMDANTDNGDMVANRIIKCFDSLYVSSRVSIAYDIAKMEGKC